MHTSQINSKMIALVPSPYSQRLWARTAEFLVRNSIITSAMMMEVIDVSSGQFRARGWISTATTTTASR
jgi:hypothetical protein